MTVRRVAPTRSHRPGDEASHGAASIYRIAGGPTRPDPAHRPPLIIEQTWRTEPLMAVCALGWLAFQPALFMAAHESNAFATHHGVGALCLLGFGFVYFYRSLVGFANRSTLTITDSDVYVRFGPLPWPGARRLPVRDIVSIELLESPPQTWFRRIVVARLRDGRSVPLTLGVRSRAQGRYVARAATKELARRQGVTPKRATPPIATHPQSLAARSVRRSRRRRSEARPRKRYRDAFGSYW